MENNKNQTPVTEEVKKWSIDFMKSVETEGYESMDRKLNELTPELKVGVLEFLKTVTDYCVENDLWQEAYSQHPHKISPIALYLLRSP